MCFLANGSPLITYHQYRRISSLKVASFEINCVGGSNMPEVLCKVSQSIIYMLKKSKTIHFSIINFPLI